MRFAIHQGETDPAKVAQRLYTVTAGERAPAQQRRRAQRALMDANPQLSQPGGIAAGTPIRVPEVPGMKFTADASPSSAVATNATGWLQTQLGNLQAAFDESTKAIIDGANLSIQQAKALSAKTVRQEPGLKSELDQVAAKAKEQIAQAQAVQAFRAELVQQIGKDLEAASGRFASQAGYPPLG